VGNADCISALRISSIADDKSSLAGNGRDSPLTEPVKSAILTSISAIRRTSVEAFEA